MHVRPLTEPCDATMTSAPDVKRPAVRTLSIVTRATAVAATIALMAATSRAQTLRVVPQGDSALVIAQLAPCSAPCTDSARVEWRYGSQYVTRIVRSKSADTLRVLRLTENSAYLDSARLNFIGLSGSRARANVATFVQPLSAASVQPKAPVNTPVTNTAAATSTPSVSSTGGASTGAPSESAVAKSTTATSPAAAPAAPPPPAGKYAEPARPASLSFPYPAITGKTHRVAAGGDLQDALDDAEGGDEIVLANGAKFRGNFLLPAKRGNAWIVIRGEAKLPITGTRIDATTLNYAAQIITPNSDPAIRTAPGAAHYRIVGVQIAHETGAKYNYGIAVFGRGDEKSVAEMPTDIVLDRVHVHGSTTDGNSRCITFNGSRLAVVDSWITECHAKGYDAQGVCGWNGPGPFLIQNNRIEASGQGVMFGGADPRIKDVLPSDITIRRNHIFKPMAWGRGRWTVKAGFELKNAKRVLFEGNVIENHWADAQTGFAILFQTLADNNSSWAWTTVQDVLVQNNIIRNSTSGVNVLARVAYNGGTLPTNPTSRVVFINNRFENVGKDPISGTAGIALQLLSDLRDVTFTRNTFTLAGSQMQKAISFDGKAQTRTTISDNVFPASSYPMTGNGTGAGTPTVNAFMPGGVFRGNVLPGASAATFPAGGVSNSASGADISAINTATSGVVR